MPTNIKEIARELATQDNLMTDQPIWLVQQRRRVSGLDDSVGDSYEWVAEDGLEPADEEESKKCEDHFEETGEELEGFTRNYYLDIWDFVTACFTKAGCEAYIAANGHNLKSPRIYADGSYRNAEYQAVRNFLMAQLPKESNAPTL